MVQDAEFRVSAFAMEVEIAVFLLVEVHAPFHEALDTGRTAFHHLFHGAAVRDVVAGNHGVLDVFFEVVHFEVGDGSDAALSLGRIGLFNGCFANEGHLARGGHLEGVTHSSHTGTNYQKIEFAYHLCVD